VQIASGGEKSVKTYNPGVTLTDITQAPSRAAFAGHTYLYFASTDHVFRYDVTSNLASGSFLTTGTVNASVRLIGSTLWATDTLGRLYQLYGDPSAGSGSFANLTSYPMIFVGASLSVPYIDSSAKKVYFGDQNGKVYKIDIPTATQTTGWPIATGGGAITASPLSVSGKIIAGDASGHVFYIDDATHTLTYTVTLSGSISTIAFNAAANSSAGEVMVGTSTGGLYLLPKQLP
jgi:outer membrane protein assembly factor BamB